MTVPGEGFCVLSTERMQCTMKSLSVPSTRPWFQICMFIANIREDDEHLTRMFQLG